MRTLSDAYIEQYVNGIGRTLQIVSEVIKLNAKARACFHGLMATYSCYGFTAIRDFELSNPRGDIEDEHSARCCSFGISHSSFKIPNAWVLVDQAGVSGYYVPLEIHPDNFEEALKNMPKLGFRANVTIPHKERALEIADFISERAQRIGAANTLYLMWMVKFTRTIQMDMVS